MKQLPVCLRVMRREITPGASWITRQQYSDRLGIGGWLAEAAVQGTR